MCKCRRLKLVLLVCSALTGCASLNARLPDSSDGAASRGRLYPGTQADASIIAYAVSRPLKPLTDPAFTPDAQEGLVWLYLPFSVIDLPLSLAADTILLPHDIYQRQVAAGSPTVADPEVYLRTTPPM